MPWNGSATMTAVPPPLEDTVTREHGIVGCFLQFGANPTAPPIPPPSAFAAPVWRPALTRSRPTSCRGLCAGQGLRGFPEPGAAGYKTRPRGDPVSAAGPA